MMTTLKPELVIDVGAHDGEGPFWLAHEQRLGWVDIGAGALHITDVARGTDDVIAVGSPLGAAAPRRGGGYVLAVEDGFALIDPGSREARLVAPVDSDGGRVRMNDGKCDAQGRFWAGTMAYDHRQRLGAFYRLDPDLTVTKIFDGLGISNGLDWSPDGRTFYYIDSLDHRVDVFDADPATGSLANRRTAVEVPDDPSTEPGMAVPDGMTLDAEGHLWVAVWGGGEVRRYSPSGALEVVVEMPVVCPSACTFGGADLGDLYITTMVPSDVGRGPLPGEGAVYRVRPGVRGLPVRAFAG